MQDEADFYAEMADKQQTISGIYVSQAEEQLQNVNEKAREAEIRLETLQKEVGHLESEKNALRGDLDALRGEIEGMEAQKTKVQQKGKKTVLII